MSHVLSVIIFIYISIMRTHALFLRGLFTETNSVKYLISSQAFISSVTTHVNNQLFSEITSFHIHPQIDSFYIVAYGITQYELNRIKNAKWLEIEQYSQMQKTTNQLLFILLIIFTKGVENAI